MWKSLATSSLFLTASLFTGCSMTTVTPDSDASKALQPPLKINKILVSKPFHPNSVSPGVSLVNQSGQTLKAISFMMRPYNAPKNKAVATQWQLFSGPFPADAEEKVYWGYPWNDATIYCTEIEQAELVFADGSKLKYDSSQIAPFFNNPNTNICKHRVH